MQATISAASAIPRSRVNTSAFGLRYRTGLLRLESCADTIVRLNISSAEFRHDPADRFVRKDLSHLNLAEIVAAAVHIEDMAHELLVHTLKGMSGTIRAMNESQAAALRYIRGQH